MAISNPQKKVLSFTDILIMTVVANFGIRWLAVAAGIGPSSIVYWCLGAVMFFLPLVIITSKLSKLYPESSGGVYTWTRNILGEKPAFMVAWLYWVTNIFYYPAVLIFLATNFSYFLGKPALANNHIYITCCVLAAFWLIVIISMFGIRASKYLVNWGGILGTFIPTIALLLLALLSLIILKQHATDFSPKQFIPNQHIFNSLSTLTIIMFAMAGLEVIPTFANSVRKPRDLYLGLIIGATIIFTLYTLGTLAMNVLVDPASISSASGLMQSFSIIDNKFHTTWLTRFFAFLLTFSELAAITVWLLAPAIMLFKCAPKGVFPDWLHKTNTYGTPSYAIFFMGGLVTGIILLTNIVPIISDMYQVLVLMATILYFIPYLFLAVVFIKSRRSLKINSIFACVLGIFVLVSISLGIIFSLPPPSNLTKTHDMIAYEAELILGPAFFISIGWALYTIRKK